LTDEQSPHVPEAEWFVSSLSGAVAQTRNIARMLAPEAVTDPRLCAALSALAKEAKDLFDVACVVTTPPLCPDPPPPECPDWCRRSCQPQSASSAARNTMEQVVAETPAERDLRVILDNYCTRKKCDGGMAGRQS
jgi:hypothetical protein